jgi:hypothetical protein
VYIYFAATDARVIHTFDSRAKNDNRYRCMSMVWIEKI